MLSQAFEEPTLATVRFDERDQQVRQVLREQLGDALTPSEFNHLFLKITDADW